ncbi:MAG TPA: peptide-methionine (S)-S-oxide reductase MsrA, partial [Rectinemataceae bacterium]|nr:peptide-methionine (S)-S-oxide reductase MsrA [Rectinemataceae bacterium]
MSEEKAILAGGCFWCLEAAYKRLPGVIAVESGYSGGFQEKPTYEQVCAGLTGHAEAVRISFDPEKITFGEIIDFFWKIHDPTTENRQGADIGEQYRSAIFYLDENQKAVAEASLSAQQTKLGERIVTGIEAARKFWPAENYHQDYYR